MFTIESHIKNRIITIWDDYEQSKKTTFNTKGQVIYDIDSSRLEAIKDIQILIKKFLADEYNIHEFKTAIDSYNKRNNLWGFTAAKGQMFFNRLVRSGETNIGQLTKILKQVITEPTDLADASNKINTIESWVEKDFEQAKDKRKVPHPKSTNYFLSYFWQIHNYKKWQRTKATGNRKTNPDNRKRRDNIKSKL